MVRVTDFARPKRKFDKEDPNRQPLPPQTSAYQSQRASQNPRSEARRLKRKAIRESDKECFFCRQTGHLSQDCPENATAAEHTPKMCYRCGRMDHSLKDCKKRPQTRPGKRKRTDDDSDVSEDDVPEPNTEYLPYAKCYVCQTSGHLAGFCPKNNRGIYPNGGGCKLCGIPLPPAKSIDSKFRVGATDHLKRQCPQKEAIERGAVVARNPHATDGADEDAYHEKLRAELQSTRKAGPPLTVPPGTKKKKPKVVNF
jgi:zinc finger CCHC domain-containing protein 9